MEKSEIENSVPARVGTQEPPAENSGGNSADSGGAILPPPQDAPQFNSEIHFLDLKKVRAFSIRAHCRRESGKFAGFFNPRSPESGAGRARIESEKSKGSRKFQEIFLFEIERFVIAKLS